MRQPYLFTYSACTWNSTFLTYFDDYYRRCVLSTSLNNADCPSSPSYYALNLNTYGICVQYCPNGTYSLDSNRTCVTTCPVYYFVNYTLNVVQYQCVATCPSRTFLSNFFCVNATSCSNGTYGDPYSGACVSDCNPTNSSLQTYANTNPNVKLCVLVCPPNFYKQNMYLNHTCVSSCLTNFFIDYATLTCVAICPNGSYAHSTGECLTSCPNGLYADDDSHLCRSTCVNGTFRDDTSNFCVSKCPAGYFGDITGNGSTINNTYMCVKTCSNTSEYGDPVIQLCVVKTSCSSPYIYADDYSRHCVTLCPISRNTFGDQSNYSCLLNCTWGPTIFLYRDPSTQTCVATCPLNPSLYADITTQNCVPSCPVNYFAVDSNRTCQTSCPNNFYMNNVTQRCVSTCSIDPILTYYYAVNTTSSQCLQYCPGSTLADPTTMSCITTQCPSLPSLFAFNNTCISICPNGTYANSNLRICDSNCTGSYLID